MSGDPYFFFDISSSWVERSLHAKFHLHRLPKSGSSMVGDNKQVPEAILDVTEAILSSCNNRGFLSPS